MATTDKFKQIGPFSSRAEAQPAPQPDSDVTPVTPE